MKLPTLLASKLSCLCVDMLATLVHGVNEQAVRDRSPSDRRHKNAPERRSQRRPGQ